MAFLGSCAHDQVRAFERRPLLRYTWWEEAYQSPRFPKPPLSNEEGGTPPTWRFLGEPHRLCSREWAEPRLSQAVSRS